MSGVCLRCPDHGKSGQWCSAHHREISTRTQGPDGGPSRPVNAEECCAHGAR